jgi:hypothetical protein
MDTRIVGAISPTPLRVRFYQNDPDYEADHNIDVNMDGDMTDGATNFESVLSPVLIQDANYHRISFTADQGVQRAYMNYVPPFPEPPRLIPLTPEFNPTVTVKFTVIFGDEQFGSDAGNIVSVDNIHFEAIPEPGSITLAAMLVWPLAWRRNRAFLSF